MLWVFRFSTDSLEQEYQAQLVNEKIRLTRIMAVLAISLNLAFVVLDLWAIPSALAGVWSLRAGIVAVLVLTLASTWSPRFRDAYPYIVLLAFAVMGGSINAMILIASPSDAAIDPYYGGVLLVIIGLYTLTYVNALPSVLMSVGLLAVYALVVMLAHRYDSGPQRVVLIANLFVGASVTTIGFVARALRERYARENYLLRHSLQRDVEIKEEEKRRAAYLAEHDPLTGLPNRLRFEREATALLDQAANEGGLAVLMFIDLDGFKPVNDRYGHAAGDRALKVIAQRLRARLRAQDICARVGGDEFVVAMAVATDDRRAIMATADRLAGAINAAIEVRGAETLHLSASIGVAVHPDDGADLDAVLRAADERMYQVKRDGKSGIAVTPGCEARQLVG